MIYHSQVLGSQRYLGEAPPSFKAHRLLTRHSTSRLTPLNQVRYLTVHEAKVGKVHVPYFKCISLSALFSQYSKFLVSWVHVCANRVDSAPLALIESLIWQVPSQRYIHCPALFASRHTSLLLSLVSHYKYQPISQLFGLWDQEKHRHVQHSGHIQLIEIHQKLPDLKRNIGGGTCRGVRSQLIE